MKKILKILPALLLYLGAACTQRTIKIACIGDSITEGYGLVSQSISSYPVMLDSILGSGYAVLNFGRSSTTLEKNGNFPYWICKEFSNVFAYHPDIVLVQLGTNDTKPENWQGDDFETDYQALIDTLKTIPGKPEIILCLPVPVFETRWGINDSTVVHGIIPVIKKMAKINNLRIIDLNSTMKNEGKNFPDGIHPNEKGVKHMAEIVAEAIVK
jgi:acyl-CoA thioesterase-1